MLFMRCVGFFHSLVLDIDTDCSHLLNENGEILFTFNSRTEGFTPDGKIICHLHVRDNNWVCENDLGIECKPVSFDKMEGVFSVEAEFCEKWLRLNGVDA